VDERRRMPRIKEENNVTIIVKAEEVKDRTKPWESSVRE